ncbi:integrator complex subunit 4 [Ditylenchus destructor]|nr:integrator complex subunit 4 [Ditylenchus destructor]
MKDEPKHDPVLERERSLMKAAHDMDKRMRTAALQELSHICERVHCLSLDSYRAITELCDNSEKRVRLLAAKIVQIYAENYPDHHVKTTKGFRLRLHDDAFAIVCHLLNDLEPDVRSEAARLLGCFTSVSETFLHQTLDKKLMRQMRMLNDGTVSKDAGSKWSTGKKLGEDIPMEKDDEESQSLIPTGACGGFVTALEDEFMAVRQAAVYSLGKLAANRPEFANKCIDHLADMFNDEIQQVRLDAIKALSPLVIHGTLQQDQLHTILTVLDDANSDNRMAVHELLSKSNLADADCVKQCINVLLHSLKRFPFDKPSIYKCLSALGRRHSLFVHGLVTELLDIHPIFATPEKHIDDDFYLGRLILVLNAASRNPVISSLIPAYVKKHYRYLRCASPNLIPMVKEIEDSNKTDVKTFDFSTLADNKIDDLLNSVVVQISEAYAKKPSEREILFEMILRDLQSFENIEEEVAVPAGFLHKFARIVQILSAALNSAQDLDQEFVHLAFASECLFKLYALDIATKTDAQWPELHLLSEVIRRIKSRLQRLNVKPSASLENLFSWITSHIGIKKEEPGAPPFSTEEFIMELRKSASRPPKRIENLKRISIKSVRVIDPNKDVQNDVVIRFVAGLPSNVSLNCLLLNLTELDLQRLRIQVTYPDQTSVYFRPRQGDFSRLNDRTVRLQTQVIITAPLWAEPANVQLCCGLLLLTEDLFNAKSESTVVEKFAPLPDADMNMGTPVNISMKIHPMLRA